jgi:hypothetical protein
MQKAAELLIHVHDRLRVAISDNVVVDDLTARPHA